MKGSRRQKRTENAVGFGSALRRLRTAHGLSVAELADKLGCSADTVSGYERGENLPRANRRQQIADLLGVSSSRLTGFEERQSPFLPDGGQTPSRDQSSSGEAQNEQGSSATVQAMREIIINLDRLATALERLASNRRGPEPAA